MNFSYHTGALSEMNALQYQNNRTMCEQEITEIMPIQSKQMLFWQLKIPISFAFFQNIFLVNTLGPMRNRKLLWNFVTRFFFSLYFHTLLHFFCTFIIFVQRMSPFVAAVGKFVKLLFGLQHCRTKSNQQYLRRHHIEWFLVVSNTIQHRDKIAWKIANVYWFLAGKRESCGKRHRKGPTHSMWIFWHQALIIGQCPMGIPIEFVSFFIRSRATRRHNRCDCTPKTKRWKRKALCTQLACRNGIVRW